MFILINDKTILTFGKYKGYTASYVINKNPDYLLWCAENIPWFKVDSKLMEEIRKSSIDMSRKRLDYIEKHSDYRDRIKEPVYDYDGRKISYDEMTKLTSTYDYDEETGNHSGYTEHMHTIVPVTYHSDGGSTVHFGGPCGPLYVDEFGNT